jgi:transcriptional regulator with XRE-family HTH domain
MKLLQLLENAEILEGSAARAAARIGVSRARWSGWKGGEREPTDDQCSDLAELIGVPWWVVVAASNAAKAERLGDIPKARQWRERISQVTAPVILAAMLGLFGLGHPSEAGAAQKSMAWRGLSTIYIMMFWNDLTWPSRPDGPNDSRDSRRAVR